ncbi:hypothetical protein [Paraburkholderia lycopersici]|uniref:Uncharacterized protein n=1 Tax=Paraburkholderia lycopersici TaxID=416944 RepID=A0A1G6Z370_9BURK|nr:hypothetical protein [Paraburkholderia lycopersici]SDD96397.1 hypothetical protein SAMN05421548_12945 [Paraburkholderia lycopersici]
MKVQDLLALLAQVDPQAEVLFLGQYADADEADAVRLVDIRREAWTHERGRYGNNEPYEAYYSGKPCERDSSYRDVVTKSVRVVMLSAGPTNLLETSV